MRLRFLALSASVALACGRGATATPEPVDVDAGVDAADGGAAHEAWFRDVTDEAGVLFRRGPHEYGSAAERFSGGVCVLDADGDGRMDLFFAGTSRPRAAGPHLYVARGPLRFVDETAARGLSDVGRSGGCLAFDVDGDGDADLLTTGLGGARLFRNDGGKFVDVSSRLGKPFAPDVIASSAIAYDADGDGDLDLAIGGFGRYVAPIPGTPCGPSPCEAAVRFYEYGGTVLLLQNDDGTFEDATSRIGRRPEPGLVLLATDLDEDGSIDLFVGNDFAHFKDRYFRRLPDGSFEDIAETLGVAFGVTKSGISSMSTWDADVDGDGHLDLVESSNDAEPNPLFRCVPKGKCVDVALDLELFRTPANFRWGQALVDLDGDSVLELLEAVGHYDAVFEGDGLSPDVPTMAAPLLWHRDDVTKPFALRNAVDVKTGGRGLVVSDLDDDGDLDVVIGTAFGRPLVLENVRPQRGSSVRLALRGKGKNRFAVGAKVWVRAGGRSFPFVVHAGSGWMGNSDPRIHVGVGAAKTITVDVDWPSGKKTRGLSLPAKGTHTLEEP